MDYLPELDNFVLTNDPLVHILENLCDKSLYNLKLVNKFYCSNEKVAAKLTLKQGLKASLIIRLFGKENLIANKGSNIPHDFISYYRILMQMTYETLTNIKLDIDIRMENLHKMCTYMHIYFYGTEKHLIEVGTYHSWYTGPQPNHFKIFFNDQTITLEFNETNFKENMNKLRDVFMEIDKDNIISIFKKYYT